MSILGIDYGEKRVGLAIEIENIAMPLKIVERYKIIKELKKIIKEKNIKKIVIGEAFDLYGFDTKTLKKTRNFKEKLKEIFPDLEVFSVDERFTTKIIDNSKQKRDDLSAVLILETFLARQKK